MMFDEKTRGGKSRASVRLTGSGALKIEHRVLHGHQKAYFTLNFHNLPFFAIHAN
jgi:hypothetical protein